MKSASTAKRFPADAKDWRRLLANAPKRVVDPDSPYDPNDPKAVRAFWKRAKLRRPGERGPQKGPTKIALSLRLSPEVVRHFKATGRGWQTRIDDALKKVVAPRRRPASKI